MTASGVAAIAWTPVKGGLSPLRARFRAGGAWGPSRQLTARGRSAQQVELAFDDRDRATIAWGSLHGIHARQWRAGRLGADATTPGPGATACAGAVADGRAARRRGRDVPLHAKGPAWIQASPATTQFGELHDNFGSTPA